MEKTINSVTFVPIWQMNENDWEILDWDFLRNKAKNRIASSIIAGTLSGFHHVNVLMKGRAKPDYYWPTEFGDEELDSDTAEFFRYEADDEFQSDEVENVDQTIIELQLLNEEYQTRLLERLIAFVTAGVPGAVALQEDIMWLENLHDNLMRSILIPTWAFLPLAIYIFRWWGISMLEEVLAKIDKELNNG